MYALRAARRQPAGNIPAGDRYARPGSDPADEGHPLRRQTQFLSRSAGTGPGAGTGKTNLIRNLPEAMLPGGFVSKILAEFAPADAKNSSHFSLRSMRERKCFSDYKCWILPLCGKIIRAADYMPFVGKTRRGFRQSQHPEALLPGVILFHTQ